MRCKLAQGVTTTVIGNCGLGCAPVANGEAEGILRAVNAWMTPSRSIGSGARWANTWTGSNQTDWL